MSFNQTRDILDHAREFHRRLIRFYDGLRGLTESEETARLLEELIARERQLEARLADYEERVSENTLDTFFKYVLATTEQEFRDYFIPDEVDSEFVIAAARYFDERLSRFYESMAAKALSVQVRDVLENLREMEQREQLTLSKMELEMKEG